MQERTHFCIHAHTPAVLNERVVLDDHRGADQIVREAFWFEFLSLIGKGRDAQVP